ncbi:putative basic amino acid antiporter YfcC [Acidaminobacter sp. JC074]|uniref:YfcC family protein n=1 Tax=Acidaminobacter sp. JC074 TaxID=2530199 RepID=UPI001F114361|nr:AbgT family transporter [Acidaminobacter sp. JC074]MCH4886478.1 putative basic amino acid antiporter YfcC [Acidaminobacter sp. JC074]
MEQKKTKLVEEKKKKFKVPHTYVLLFSILVVVALLTYIVPAGEFVRAEDPNTGRIAVVADSYHRIENTPVTPFNVFTSLPKGMEKSGYIIFFVLLIGGTFGVLQATGAINSGIGALVDKLKGNEKMVIPVSMLVFSLGGAVFGLAEETLMFIPIFIALSLALGFDTITGIAICLLGAGAGFSGAFMNPFTVGVAQGIAGLPPFSGFAFRMVVYVVVTIVTILLVYRHAAKVQKNPTLSPTYELDKKNREKFHLGEMDEFTTKHKLVLLSLAATVGVIAYGVMKLGFYITELGALFVILALVAGAIGGLKPDQIADEFINGSKDMIYGALVIGLATSITVILTEGSIIDTVIFHLAESIKGLPPALSGVGMFITQTCINLFVPSGSGQAAVTMPIMAPLADIIGITRQTAVLAYQFGDGFSNNIIPTSGVLMAGLAIGGVSWDKWAKWMMPIFLIWSAIGAIFVTIATLIEFGPF